MRFELTQEISSDVDIKSEIISKISNQIKAFFELKNYGTGIEEMYIGVICVAPEFDMFYNIRKFKYTKREHCVEYDIKLDHLKFKKADREKIEIMLIKKISESLINFEKKSIPDFDYKSFIEDFQSLFQFEEK